MSKPMHKPNRQRRLVVQGAALTGAAMAVPGFAKAFSHSSNTHSTNTHSSDTLHSTISGKATSHVSVNDQVTIELIESHLPLNDDALARVTITNRSDNAINLSHLSPGTIATQKGVYPINANLRDNPIAIRPNGVYQFWVEKDDGTQLARANRPKLANDNAYTPTMLEVSVVTQTEAGPWTGTQRVQAII